MSLIVDTSGALDLQNPNAMSPAPTANRGRGFLNWLGNNYKDVAQTAVNVACLFNPEKCPQGGTTVVQPQPQQQPSGPSIYIILAVVVVVAILLIVILKK
ncbi:hypothetical protein [Phaeodactylibacter sp.]|uniref:hypothetical protein n=1 Tax=Phaeodactylibacter sp. TaxID=1940289 RepID=UPI0025E7D951|nr:hypothetical protein [Phaeodactylibacter sp.]MCI4650850.1 hypothetical protein [Phaeodactylibacter sp.]MCI5089807.1 hypothetical protein [Phaeodactylibacter sp.]